MNMIQKMMTSLQADIQKLKDDSNASDVTKKIFECSKDQIIRQRFKYLLDDNAITFEDLKSYFTEPVTEPDAEPVTEPDTEPDADEQVEA